MTPNLALIHDPLRAPTWLEWRHHALVFLLVLVISQTAPVNEALRPVAAQTPAGPKTSPVAPSTGTPSDSVSVLASGTNPAATFAGQIVDYTGKQLELEVAGGVKRKFPAEQVSDVTTVRLPEHVAGDECYARQDYAAATLKYQAAYERETRRWVRRQILAQLVRSARGQQAFAQAGEFFLHLLKDDPLAIDFAAIPLAWLTTDTGGASETKALDWLKRDDPVAQLLGASHLLLGAQRPAAEAQLQQLSKHRDLRIATLADAQRLRIHRGLVDAQAVQQASAQVANCPEKLRAGPYYILGKLAYQAGEIEFAALALMRVPILYAQDHALASESLLLAADGLLKLERLDDSRRLAQELIATYPTSRAAREGRQRASDWGLSL